jgi:hypothetical protein
LAAIPDPWEDGTNDESSSTPDESAALLRRALDQIRPTVEPQSWEAFWSTAVLGRSAREVADELGLTRGRTTAQEPHSAAHTQGAQTQNGYTVNRSAPNGLREAG